MKTILLALALLCASFSAQASNELAASIMGQVVNADKAPVVGALVVIEQLDTGRVLVRHTDKRGRYRALNVRHDGTYRVTVISPSGNAYAFEGGLQLGHDHRRNFVVDFNPDQTPAFMRGWQWNMNQAQVDPLNHGRAA